MLKDVWHSMRRSKNLAQDSDSSKLARVLNLLDLTALGVGSTLGLGVYVLAGAVAKTVAGPAVCISFLIAAIASIFAGLCYSEFAARMPRAGSAYIYSYITVGEFIAFTIGWNLILEYMLATASVARGTSAYIDTLFDNIIKRTTMSVMPLGISYFATHPDFLALLFVIIATILLAAGVKVSTKFNSVLTLLNISTVVTVVIGGCFYVDVNNWKIHSKDIPEEYLEVSGTGGFMPFGVTGIMAGAARCFYGFVGFDCVATTGEEAINPRRNIPLAIMLSLVIIFLAYFSMSVVITLMWPYYLQDADAPFPYVFQQVNQPIIKWIVSIGAIFALCTNVLGSFFPLPRIIYAMSNDGVLFKILAQINTKTKTPVLATLVSGCFAGVLAVLFDLDVLIDMLSIGTLLAYTIVAVCVLILRYDLEDDAEFSFRVGSRLGVLKVCKQAMHLKDTVHPTSLSAAIAKSLISTFFLMSLLTSVAITWLHPPWSHTLLGIFGLMCVLSVIVLWLQPKQPSGKYFTVPLLPILPCCSIFINLYLMVQLNTATWIRFIVWLLIGYLIYFGYGLLNSNLADDATVVSTDTNKDPHDKATTQNVTSQTAQANNKELDPNEKKENKIWKARIKRGTDEEFTISPSISNDNHADDKKITALGSKFSILKKSTSHNKYNDSFSSRNEDVTYIRKKKQSKSKFFKCLFERLSQRGEK